MMKDENVPLIVDDAPSDLVLLAQAGDRDEPVDARLAETLNDLIGVVTRIDRHTDGWGNFAPWNDAPPPPPAPPRG